MDIKKLIRAFRTDVLMLFAFAGIMLYQGAPLMLVSLKPAVSFQDLLDGKEVKKGSHVAGDVVYTLDYFASQSTYTQRSDGSRSGSRKSGNYYLVPTSTGYIALKSRQADVETLNKLVDETFEFLSSGTEPTTKFHMEGAVKPLEGNLVNYYNEYLEELGYTDTEIQEMGDPLVVEFVSFGAVRIFFVIGLVLLALAIFILWRRYKKQVRGSGLNRVEDLPDTPAS